MLSLSTLFTGCCFQVRAKCEFIGLSSSSSLASLVVEWYLSLWLKWVRPTRMAQDSNNNSIITTTKLARSLSGWSARDNQVARFSITYTTKTQPFCVSQEQSACFEANSMLLLLLLLNSRICAKFAQFGEKFPSLEILIPTWRKQNKPFVTSNKQIERFEHSIAHQKFFSFSETIGARAIFFNYTPERTSRIANKQQAFPLK